MNILIESVKSICVRGFMVVLPLLLLYLVVDEAVEVTSALAAPVASLMLGDTVKGDDIPAHLAVAILVGATLVLGLLAGTRWSSDAGAWIERQTLMRLPVYRLLRDLGRNVTSVVPGSPLSAALLRLPDGSKEYVFLVERHDAGRCTVMIPRAPTPLVGAIRVVPEELLEPVNASVADVSRVVSQWGMGSGDLLARDEADTCAPTGE